MQKEQSVVEDRKEAVKDKLKKDMADLQNDVVNIDERIKQIEAKIKNPEKLRMTVEKFSNSLNSLINRLEKGDLVEKDILIIFGPEFSTSWPVGDPGGSWTHNLLLRTELLYPIELPSQICIRLNGAF